MHGALFIPFFLLFESIPSIRVFRVRSRYLVPFVIVLITLCTMIVFVLGNGQSVLQALGPVTDISLVRMVRR